MPITHAKVSVKSDGSDAAQVQPSDWNDDHLGSLTAYSGAILRALVEATVGGAGMSYADAAGITRSLFSAGESDLFFIHSDADNKQRGQVYIDESSTQLIRADSANVYRARFDVVGGDGGVEGYLSAELFDAAGFSIGTLRFDATGLAINSELALTAGNVAAFVANGSTVDQLRDALIAAGLMAAS